MYDAYGADANHVREADFGCGLLARSRLAAKLTRDFRYLADSGRTDRMPHREQAA